MDKKRNSWHWLRQGLVVDAIILGNGLTAWAIWQVARIFLVARD
jgi:hypothetical protein